jgi:hypothetical protein
MAFVRCVLAGVVAVIGAAALAALGVAGFLWWFGGYVGASAVSLLPMLGVVVLIFAAGFWWQWRRAH